MYLQLTALRLMDQVTANVESWPPLTDEQRHTLAGLLNLRHKKRMSWMISRDGLPWWASSTCDSPDQRPLGESFEPGKVRALASSTRYQVNRIGLA